MAGSISLSGSQQLDVQGKPLAGGKLYFFQSGTSNPQNAFKDAALTLAHPNPIELLADGRVPFFYLADGTIKIRLANASGVTQIAEDGLLVIGPSTGGGGGASIDATTILATGDVKARYGTGTLVGWVRLNGRTIGSATSGASERANSDCQALFEYLWTADANLVVSTGRGGSANADWLANKTIALPDGRGCVLAALDDMGAAAAGRLTVTYFGSAATTLGTRNGSESRTLTIAQLPTVTPAGSVAVGLTDPGHFHGVWGGFQFGTGGLDSAGVEGISGADLGASQFWDKGNANGGNQLIQTKTTGITFSPSFTGTPFGSGAAHATVQPTILVTYYIKL